MPPSVDTIAEYVEQLEEDAELIVEKIDELYHSAERVTARDEFGVFELDREPVGIKKIWRDPQGETKKLQEQLKEEYEYWYARAEELVSTYLPQRLDEFERRRGDVKDYIRLNKNAKFGPERYVSSASGYFADQRNIVKAIPGKIEVEKLKLRRQISETFSMEELQQARELLDEDLIRAAGVLAGVALERHLQTECDGADLQYSHDDGIASLAQTLFSAGEINKTSLSNLETLGQIRNDCTHANPTEPNKHRVGKLIEDTDDYVRGRGI